MLSPALRRRTLGALLIAVLATVTLMAIVAASGPASAAQRCPVPDNDGNIAVIRGAETARLPGSTNADFCGAEPDHALTQVWNDGPAWNIKRLEVRDVGTWKIAGSGRISFTPDPAFLVRPAGDSSAGHDAMLKYKVMNAERDYTAGLATVYVLYPGATARPDVVRTAPDQPITVKPLRNDVASWSGEDRDTLRQASFGPSSVRLVGADGDQREVRTAQGTWRVEDDAVAFSPAADFEGQASPVRYVATDSRGERARSTITVVVGDGPFTPVAGSASTGSGQDTGEVAVAASGAPASAMRAPDSASGVSPRVWLPVALAALLAALALFGLKVRRRHAA